MSFWLRQVQSSPYTTGTSACRARARLLLPFTEPLWSTKYSLLFELLEAQTFLQVQYFFGMFPHTKCVQITCLTRSSVSSETNPNVIYKLCRWNGFKVSVFQGAGKEGAVKLRTGRYLKQPKVRTVTALHGKERACGLTKCTSASLLC